MAVRIRGGHPRPDDDKPKKPVTEEEQAQTEEAVNEVRTRQKKEKK